MTGVQTCALPIYKIVEPVWFNEHLEKESMSEEEALELESILNKYKS